MTRFTSYIKFMNIPPGGRALFLEPPDREEYLDKKKETGILFEIAGSVCAKTNVSVKVMDIASIEELWDEDLYDIIIIHKVLSTVKHRTLNAEKTIKLLFGHLTAKGRMYVLEENLIGLSRAYTPDTMSAPLPRSPPEPRNLRRSVRMD